MMKARFCPKRHPIDLIQWVNNDPTGKFGLKPGGFRRHYPVCVRHTEQLFNTLCVHRKRDATTTIDQAHKLCRSTNTADKFDALVRARIIDTQYRCQLRLLQDGNI